jgi:uncharacterized protein YcbX
MSVLTLSEIYIYPIKSLGGIRLSSAQVEERGLKYDRRWMLIDGEGTFLTQRAFPEMALLGVELMENGLRVSHRQRALIPLFIPFEKPNTLPISVVVWDDTCQALPVSDEADAWFSHVLDKSCRLVYMPDDSVRRVDEKYVAEPLNVSLSDGYPLLIIGQASLDHLNSQLPERLPMNRFRPNLVFTGGEPHDEDTWQNFRIGAVDFRGVKLCARCVMTTINQQTLEKGKEPLRTLAKYRSKGNKILFGQNLISLSGGTVRVGDTISLEV